jgi:hypothetical protein
MILVRLKGGLGNQMFQYATALALAEKHATILKMELTLLKDRSASDNAVYRDYELFPFCLNQLFASQSEIYHFHPPSGSIGLRIKNRIKKFFGKNRVYIEKGHGFDPSLLEQEDDFCLVGAFQSEKYFSHIREKILQAYSFRTHFNQKTEDLAVQLKSKEVACIHVRRGDYVSNALYSQILGALPATYYLEGFQRVSEVRNIQEVYVFSDDINWCMHNLSFGIKTVYVTEELVPSNHHAHLYLMSQCKTFVISNSSFSWWAAWMSQDENKLVVAPRNWFADKTRDSKDILPSQWLQI